MRAARLLLLAATSAVALSVAAFSPVMAQTAPSAAWAKNGGARVVGGESMEQGYSATVPGRNCHSR